MKNLGNILFVQQVELKLYYVIKKSVKFVMLFHFTKVRIMSNILHVTISFSKPTSSVYTPGYSSYYTNTYLTNILTYDEPA